jgi:endonuclease III
MEADITRKMHRARKILMLLNGRYPLTPALIWHNSWQLLVAVMLSAQSTDEIVNRVTPALFEAFPTPADMADASIELIASMISSVNYYKTKARHLHETSKMLSTLHNDQIPQSMEELLKFPGVARKTANVVLTHAFGILEGVVVDTHVIRLVHRLDLSEETQREKIEKDLMKLVPRQSWGDFATLLVYHGRRVCKAQKPRCDSCELANICHSRAT